MQLNKCLKCGKEKKEKDMVEIINKGIKQTVFYDEEGYIVKEITEYKNKGKWLCKKCYKRNK